jgi:hypothetical protein
VIIMTLLMNIRVLVRMIIIVDSIAIMILVQVLIRSPTTMAIVT